MAIDIIVNPAKWRRVVLVRFERAKTGDPAIAYPQPDDRGYLAPERGPIFGVVQGQTVRVRLLREMIARNARLIVSSSDNAVFEIVSPSSRELPAQSEMEIQIRGVAGGTPATAKLEVRAVTDTSHGTPTGPIIHEAAIWVWDSLHEIPVKPHRVTVELNSGPRPRPARASTANVGQVMDVANAIWRPCGIGFVPHGGATWDAATAALTVAAPNTGQVDLDPWPGGPDVVLQHGVTTAGVINAYFIWRFNSPGTLGLGISPAVKASDGFTHPGIILADETKRSDDVVVRHTVPFSGNDLAHEVGHFLGLSHCENVHSNSPATDQARVADTWTRRSLMYWRNRAGGNTTQSIIGYGEVDGVALRGAMVTMKDLTQRATDAECARARSNLNAF